jgi:hypothetical protein
LSGNIASEVLEDILLSECLNFFTEKIVSNLESGISIVVSYHR